MDYDENEDLTNTNSLMNDEMLVSKNAFIWTYLIHNNNYIYFN